MKLKGEIILIDDEHYEKDFIEEVLRRLNYKVELIYFDNAKDGMEYIRSTKKDIFLIISDMRMGDMTGLKFKELLNNNENTRLKSIPFVFTTNQPTDEIIREAYKHSIQGFFRKPNRIDELTHLYSIIINYWIVNYTPTSK